MKKGTIALIAAFLAGTLALTLLLIHNADRAASDPQTWEQLEQIVHDAFQAERDALLYENRGRSQELKDNLGKYFSTASGELQKRQHTIDVEIQSAPAGVSRSDSTITKMDYKGIFVQGDIAQASEKTSS